MRQDFTLQVEHEMDTVLEPRQSTLDFLKTYSRVLHVQKLADDCFAEFVLN